jgi:acyl-CoA reductase-like NAD-dependent aldehyde dehydrogenase
MLIDGKLVDADSGSTFENVNPATEEVLGTVADASAAEMQRAIDAARRAFDSTDWSTSRDLRKQCLAQLQAALEAEKEAFRAELIAEVGCPVMTTLGPQARRPRRLGDPLADGAHGRLSVGRGAARHRPRDGRGIDPPARAGARGRRRGHHAVEPSRSR